MSNHNIGSKRRHAIIRSLVRRDGDLCHWCRCDFNDERPRTKDHVIPRGHGGSNALGNLVLACKPCNQERRDVLRVEQALWVR